MYYLSAPFRFCLLLLPALSVFLCSIDAAKAGETLALNFELPPASSAPQPTARIDELVRYEESLPTIESSTKSSKEKSPKILPSEIELPAENTIAVQFAQNDLEVPVGGARPGYEISTATEVSLKNDPKNDSKREPGTQTWLKAAPEEASTQVEIQNKAEALSKNASALDDWIFDGGSNSLVARTVGSAEGTRRWDGEKTMAYYGHVDPGNGVWNQGTFSYQHEASSPEEADEKQLGRLKRQESQLKQKAAQWQVPFSIEVRLNGLDLANQAPLAALAKGGYIERLAEAYQQGQSGEQAIVWARTHAYFDPDTQAWDAPGLGNNRYSIQQDQERRMAAIEKALLAYNHEYIGATGLQNVPIEGVTAPSGSSLLSKSGLNQSSRSAIADFSTGEVSFDYSEPKDSALLGNVVASSSQPANVGPIDAKAIANMDLPNEGSFAFEDDLLDGKQWDTAHETVASETLDLIAQSDIEALNDEAISDGSVNGKALEIETVDTEGADEVTVDSTEIVEPSVSISKQKAALSKDRAFLRTEDKIVELPPSQK